MDRKAGDSDNEFKDDGDFDNDELSMEQEEDDFDDEQARRKKMEEKWGKRKMNEDIELNNVNIRDNMHSSWRLLVLRNKHGNPAEPSGLHLLPRSRVMVAPLLCLIQLYPKLMEQEEDDFDDEQARRKKMEEKWGKRKMVMGKTIIKMPRWKNSRKNTSIFVIRSSKRLLFTILLCLIMNL
ncbi:acidic leucine-rich nuclear phosphoprotein 32 family member C-like [Pyrus ussuriensis x Pyrus communis]|uniref:Acidic leucine-rich nuclear phosphoprotein 32 family member C-like n=1 Tax=Pyrus ussuriensis x Pyrus communis TaxID=2448454 RepID=A0A5N5F208_9ROSA|nr:acidic leucine-rich nuclear phosphoprotein 32 family member C-like [Pyrus ussuriensis x Pyrus communis]